MIPSILIVEDEPPILRLLTAAFLREPLHVDTAHDGVEAIERLSDKRYAVVLLDLMLPRVNGFEVLQWLRGREERPLVLVISAYDERIVSQLDPAIVHAVVRKPFDLEQVVEMVREAAPLWEQHRAQQPSMHIDAVRRPSEDDLTP